MGIIANFVLRMSYLPSIMLTGFLIGMLISAPMGPIGMLCIQRTLYKGRWPAFFTGVGASLSDLVYCLLTGLGLSMVTDFIEAHQILLQILGSAVLMLYGVYLFRSNPSRKLKTPKVHGTTYWKDFATGFLLTFSNPLILFFIIGLFARFGFMDIHHLWYHYVAGYLSISAGALVWWFTVTYFVDKVRAHFNVRSMWLINRVIAVILLLMSGVGIVMGVRDLL